VTSGRFPLAAPDWPDGVERELAEPSLGVHYPTDWSRRYPVRLARAVLLDVLTRPALRAIASPRVEGHEVIEELDPPVIVVANHTSHVDTPLLLSCLPERIRHRAVVGAAADYFFDKRWKAALWSFAISAIPIDRKRVNRRSADTAADLLADGWSLVIFPEGGRSEDGWGQPFKGGAAYLSIRTGAPVVPVHLAGTRHIVAKGGGALRRSPTRVTFGAPVRPAEGEDARRLGARVEAAVAVLSDEAATDWWTARRNASRGTTPPRSGPDASAWRRAWALGPSPARMVERSWPRAR
jgi:1-acyl-sn-glycerol-3-phosphate acyltransferase